MLEIVALAALAIASIGVGLNLVMAVLARPASPVVEPCVWPAITVLKPLHGAEPALAENLATLFAQDYPGEVQVVFGTRDADDPALVLARQFAAARPDGHVTVAADNSRHGANNKLSNLINMDRHARNPIVVIADSDVAWPADTLRRLVAALARPQAGLVSCLHVGRGDAGWWSHLGAMDISYRFMPSVLLGVKAGLATPVLGPTMAMTRTTLDRIGGFAAFADVLADDYEFGRAVRALGLKTLTPGFFITHGCLESGAAALVRHEMRWTVTIFHIDRAGFAGSIVLHALPLALIGAGLAGFCPLSLGVVAAAFGVRAVVKWRIDRASGTVSGPLWLMPFRDILSFGELLATFFVHKVDWRGSQFRVTRDGKLQSP